MMGFMCIIIIKYRYTRLYLPRIQLPQLSCMYSWTRIIDTIRKYGSTFYIGIAMVVLPYIGPKPKLKQT